MTDQPENATRRSFLKTASLAGAGIALAQAPFIHTAMASRSPNDTLRVAVLGVNGYGNRLAQTFARHPHAQVGWICDVDERVIGAAVRQVEEIQGRAPEGIKDFRSIVERDDLDALIIATPNHWHTPASLIGLQAGKHIYVEKPASHNPHEGELLVQAQEKTGLLVQMGNQQRSHAYSREVIGRLREGLIGRVYQARAWYANTRDGIGRGERVAVPSGLDYDLWQGPAPRRPYQDNLIHYNWHWFSHWGNGEVGNNGAHEVDIARWALGAGFPTRVTASGGRYHFDDDWEFPDTFDMSATFDGDKSLVWHGRSCNGFPIAGRSRGVTVHGTEGTVLMDRNGYEVYDRDNNKVEAFVTDPDIHSTDLHVANFVAGIREGVALNSPIVEGQRSTLLTQLATIAQRTGGALQINPGNGRIVDNDAAQAYWQRDYEPGWEPEL